MHCKVKIKDFIILRLQIKRATHDHAVSNPYLLPHSDIKLGLAVSLEEDGDKYTRCKAFISIMYFVLLRRMEMLLIEIKDVTVDEVVSMECPCNPKRRSKGFRFKTPD